MIGKRNNKYKQLHVKQKARKTVKKYKLVRFNIKIHEYIRKIQINS